MAKRKSTHKSNGVPIPTARKPSSPNPHPPGYRGMNYHLNDLAYTKTVNGLLLGHRPAPDAPVEIVDAVPLQHHWTNLSPMMEVGLGQTVNYAQNHQLQVVGFYEAPERVGDTTLSRVGECVVAKIKQTAFPVPVALVLDGSKLGEESRAALVSYVSGPASTTHCIRVEDKLNFNWSTSTRALHLIRHSNILDNFWDFDNYLEDNRAPFLTNGAVGAALNGQQSR
ncbi:hypothetical protein BGY98DRAFT_987170 [Russula aff. rugulosa BPL654]|nr:hypothetical protein BGY98DRAFT_987170 [Russula aff. rugulosa BPL654]